MAVTLLTFFVDPFKVFVEGSEHLNHFLIRIVFNVHEAIVAVLTVPPAFLRLV